MNAPILLCKDDDEHWLDLRRTGIGASEIAAVLGESNWGSPMSVYADKVAEGDFERSESEPMEWGKRLEPMIIKAYCERTGRPAVRRGELLRSSEHPWALCTLDGETGLTSVEWPLEVKNVGAFRLNEWEDGPPRHYYLQLQHQMLVRETDKATIAALVGGQRLIWQDVGRDEIEIRRIIAAGREMWDRIQSRTPPEADSSEATRRALQRLYPGESGPEVELPASLADAFIDLAEAKAAISEASERKQAAENAIKAALGHAVGGYVGRYRCTWKLQKRAAHMVKESESRVLRVKEVQ